MKIVLQRVNSASVKVDAKMVGSIGRGLMLLVGFGKEDQRSALAPMAEKISHLRVFPDDKGRFDKSLRDINGEVLLVPQFTLYGETLKGRRPEFFSALEPEKATEYFDKFVECFKNLGLAKVQSGEFGAHMKVALENDGPVTLIL